MESAKVDTRCKQFLAGLTYLLCLNIMRGFGGVWYIFRTLHVQSCHRKLTHNQATSDICLRKNCVGNCLQIFLF